MFLGVKSNMTHINTLTKDLIVNLLLLFGGLLIVKLSKSFIAGTVIAHFLAYSVVILPGIIANCHTLNTFRTKNLIKFLLLFLSFLILNIALFLRAFVYITTSNGCYNPWF